MRYMRSKLETNWPAKMPLLIRLIGIFFPDANPDYRFHLVRCWLVEFDEHDEPWREVGVGENGEPVLAGPDE